METVSKVVGKRGGLSNVAYDDLRAFRKDVAEAFGETLIDVVLFGSRSVRRGKRDSDLDVAVLLNGSVSGTEADRTLARLAYPYLLRGTQIAPISLPSDLAALAQKSLLAHSIGVHGLSVA